jgi:arylsulfatase A-like enzyme
VPHTLFLATLLLATLQACGGLAPAPGEPRHVLLISIDTLRADHCGFLGHPGPITPFLDELAARGTVFTSHYANSNNTLTSHASLLTGLVPEAHATYDGGSKHGRQRLADACDTLAERFERAGYRTAAFTTHAAWLGETFGLMQGFEHHETAWRDAKASSRAFLRWVDREQPRRMFAFLHYYDPHSEARARGTLPYDSTPELVEQFAGPAPQGFTGHVAGHPDQNCSHYLQALDRGLEPLTPELRAYLAGLYAAGVRKTDDDLRSLFTELRRRGLLEDTLVVITSDHGEEFGEHGGMLHGGWHEEVQRVPLVVVAPFLDEPQVPRVDAVTRSIDVAPTILDLARLPLLGQGHSLRPALLGEPPPPDGEVVFGQAVLRARDEHSAYRYFGEGDAEVFYDLERDPGETRNLVLDDEWKRASAMRLEGAADRLAALRAKAAEIAASLRARDAGGAPELPPEALEELRRLGYP